MKLTEAQFKLLIEIYIGTKPHIKSSDVLDNSAFKEAFEFIEQEFGEYLNLAALSTLDEDFLSEQKTLHDFLDSCLTFDATKNTFTFNQIAAIAHSHQIHSTLNSGDLLSLHLSPSNLGIREKYLKNDLGNEEWLTDIDLEHVLKTMELQNIIHITRFNPLDIGMALHFERLKNKDANQPYSVPLLLNKGSEGTSAGSHWFAGIITIDPVKNEVSYQIEDSFKLSKEQQAEIKTVIEQAISFKQLSGEVIYEAFPNSTINKGNSAIVGQQTQSDGYSCGYRALHSLFNNPLLAKFINSNIKAKAYADCANDSYSLVQYLYKILLDNLVVKPDVIAGLQRSSDFMPAVGQSEKLQLYPNQVAEYLDTIESTPEAQPLAATTQIKPSLVKILHDYKPINTTVSFPIIKDEELTSADFNLFLSSLQLKLNENKKNLDKLVITPCNLAALNGLNAFLVNNKLLCNELVIDIGDLSNVDTKAFLAKFNSLLIRLSEQDLPKVTLIDNKKVFTSEHWQNVAKFVKSRLVTVELLLPAPIQTTSIQRDIDQSVSSNRFHKTPVKPLAASDSVTPIKLGKRTRSKQDPTQSLNIDIELQQEQQVEVHVAIQRNSINEDKDPEFGELDILISADYSGFFDLLAGNKLKVSDEHYLLSEATSLELWNNWFGHVSTEPPHLGLNRAIHGISKQACEQLLKHSQQLQNGLDFNHLPQGFVVIEYPVSSGNKVVHYDLESTLYKKTNPVALILQDTPQAKAIAYPVFQDIITLLKKGSERDKLIAQQWDALQNGPYDREAANLFQHHLPNLLKLNKEQLQQFFDLSIKENQLNKTKFSLVMGYSDRITQLFKATNRFDPSVLPAGLKLLRIFGPVDADVVVALASVISSAKSGDLFLQLIANKPKLIKQYQHWNKLLGPINPDAILPVYARHGESGLNQLFSQWEQDKDHADLLKEMILNLSSSSLSLEPLLDLRYQEAISTVRGFTGAKLEWWNLLLQQHTNSGANDEFPALVEAFKEFSKVIETKGLSFYKLPQVKNFHDVKSMPTALARMLTIVNQCATADLGLQWQSITQLALDSTGAIRAITDAQAKGEHCGFILPEMKFDAQEKQVQDWHDIARQNTPEESKTELYRYLAYQKYRLPLSFYEQALNDLEKQNFTPEIKMKLAALLVAATTGMGSSFFLKGPEDSLKQWDKVIYSLNNIPLPTLLSPFKGAAQIAFVNALYGLHLPPFLPVLDQLFKLVTNSIQVKSMWSAKEELQRKFTALEKTCGELDKLTRLWGASIYQGMKFYDEEDYKAVDTNSVFFSHVATSKTITDIAVATALAGAKSGASSTPEEHALIELISTFQFNSDNVRQAKAFMSMLFEVNGSYAIELLKEMTTNVGPDNKKLTVEDFSNLVNQLMVQNRDLRSAADFKPMVIVYFQKNMAAYYPPNFFDKLLASPIPQEVMEKVLKIFPEEKELITNFLNQFSQSSTNTSYKELMQKLIFITEPMSEIERKSFLNKLQRPELYQSGKEGVKTTIAEFNTLFDAVLDRANGVNDFIYLLAQPDSIKCQGLVNKAVLYLTTILPDMDKNKSSTVSKSDALALVTQLLLVSTTESLTSSLSAVKRADQDSLDEVKKQISVTKEAVKEGKVINWQDLEKSLTALKEETSGKILSLNGVLDKLKVLNSSPVESASEVVGVTAVTPSSDTSSTIASSFRSIATGIGSFFGRLAASVPTPPPAVVVPSIPVKPMVKAPPLGLEAELLDTVLTEIDVENQRRTGYSAVFDDLFKTVYQIAEQYPGAKALIIDFVKNYIRGHNEKNGSLIVNTWNCVNTIQHEFSNLNDVDIVRSLCNHYSAKEGALTPNALLEIMTNQDFQSLGNDNKRLLLKIVAVLLNNHKAFTNDQLQQLVNLCNEKDHGSDLISVLNEFYTTAPYPTIKNIIAWDTEAKQSANYVALLKDKYAVFDKIPAEREKNNGFYLDVAKEKRNELKGITISDVELRRMASETARVRELSTADLLIEFKAVRDDPSSVDKVQLVAVAAELLYRSKAKQGSSFEINTTQYLASLAALKAGSHSTREIATGEGKSRISAIDVACQFALGKTVDFITSDVQLATRDYLEFQGYFKLLGAQTNIIMADTPASEYCIGGINYSDASNLSLFRNKARSTGDGDKVIAPKETDRALVLDEADKVYFDTLERYNFSAEGEESLKNMEWIYPLLMDFFAQDDEDPNASEKSKNSYYYYNDIDKCTSRFKKFALSKLDDNQKLKFKALPQAQLELWQESAVTARSLILNKHYVIEPDNTIMTPTGAKIASEAKLIMGNRVARHSKFSFGVQQCLHARLNKLMSYPEKARSAEDQNILRDLKACKEAFNIDPEKQIQYSSGSKTLLDDYQYGSLIAVTGTAGSLIERQEATGLYGAMQFISVPRHNGLLREDKSVQLTANSDGQVQALVERILEARRNLQPVVIFCENDNAGFALKNTLSAALADKEPRGLIQNIHSKLSLDDERKSLTAATDIGMVTVTTGMSGRGVDFKLQLPETKTHGLKILITYLPRERDLKQMLGRSGRFGDKGDSRLILNKQELKQRLGKSSLNDGFYTAPEAYIKQQQALMDRKLQCERLIKNTINDFSKRLTNNYFDDFLPKAKINLNPVWMKFNKDKDRLWNTVWQQITSEMDTINPNPALINRHLDTFQQQTQALWSDLRRQANEQLQKEKGDESTIHLLQQEVGELSLDFTTIKLIRSFNVKNIPLQTQVYDKYDSAHDGRAVIYSRPFEKLRAFFRGERRLFADFRAWQEGHGILFPNLRAFWNGHMSFTQFLFGYGKNNNATISSVREQPAVQKEKIPSPVRDPNKDFEVIAVAGRRPSSYSTMVKELEITKGSIAKNAAAQVVPLAHKVETATEPVVSKDNTPDPESKTSIHKI